MDDINNEEDLQKEEELMNMLLAATQKKDKSAQENNNPEQVSEVVEINAATEETQNSEEKSIADDYADEIIKKYKKFVIRVDEKYAPFFTDMSPNKRNKLVNEYIKKEFEDQDKNAKIKLLGKVIKHALIAIITIVVGFPVLLHVVNISINSTRESYKYMQVNFEKLYQQKKMYDL